MDQKTSVTKIPTSTIKSDRPLSISVTDSDIDRHRKIIKEYGLMSVPVVSMELEGSYSLLRGEGELWALRELGVESTDAVVVKSEDNLETAKLRLLLCTLKDNNCALTEGMVLKQLLQSDKFTQKELASIAGKSISWVSKRLNLVTRLSPSACKMVRQKQLCPHSAQEIAKLPENVQFDFAVNVVKDSIPKSKVEKLVRKHNLKSCKKKLKDMIIHSPLKAMQTLKDKKLTDSTENSDNDTKDLRSLLLKINLLIKVSSQAQGIIELLDEKQLSDTRFLAKTSYDYMQKLNAVIKRRYGLVSYPQFSPGKIDISYKKEGDQFADRQGDISKDTQAVYHR